MGRVVFVDVYMCSCCRVYRYVKGHKSSFSVPSVFPALSVGQVGREVRGWMAVCPSVFNGLLSSDF